jgi:hypothetical protein
MASLWEPVLVGTLVMVVVATSALLAAAFLAWRYGRRKLRAFHAHGAVVGARALWALAASRHLRSSGPMDDDAATRWPARTVRREMWRAVDQADAAVRAADTVGAPTAEMPSLCRRLREAAVALDRVLRIEPAGPVPPQVAAQAVEVARAARRLQGAALASAADATAPGVAQLTSDAGHEVELLDAGLARARSVLPGTRR